MTDFNTIRQYNFPTIIRFGAGAIKGIRNKMAEMQNDIDAWEETTLWADNPPS